MKTWWIKKVAGGITFFIVALTVFGLVIMALWNALVPDIFNGPVLTFWQAVGLLVLSHLLLRGWAPWRYGSVWRRELWRRRFEEKLTRMTPEEREKFQGEWQMRCRPHHKEAPETKDDRKDVN